MSAPQFFTHLVHKTRSVMLFASNPWLKKPSLKKPSLKKPSSKKPWSKKLLFDGSWLRKILPSMEDATQVPLLNSAAIHELSLRARQHLHLIPQTRFATKTDQRLSGDVRSVYKGAGLDYEESRVYQFGDEMRLMDWRLSARSGEPHIKVFREERRPGVFMVVDRRATMRFGTRARLKATQAARVAALLAFAFRQLHTPLAGLLVQSSPLWVSQCNDDAGVFDFINHIAKPCPPVADLEKEPCLSEILKAMLEIVNPGSIVYLISDFRDLEDQSRALLLYLATVHHVHAIHIVDPAEIRLPDAGQLQMLSTDGSQAVLIDTADASTRDEFSNIAAQYFSARERILTGLNIPYMRVMSDCEDIESVLGLRVT